MERFNPTIQVDEDVENNKMDGKDGDEQLQSGDERHASSAWGRLFRTAENERAPSRTRRKASVAADTSSFELQRQESVESTDSLAPGEPGLRKRKSTASSISSIITGKGKKSKGKTGPKWHTSQNPLFKSAKGEGEQEVVPFYVWGYETVLNFLWPPFNYFRIHFLWIWFLSIFGGILVYVSQLGLSSEMTFLDSLFHAVSACTQTGLFPTNFSQFSRLGQVIIGALIFLGNGVLLTTAPVIIRIYYYRKYFKKNQIANPRTDEYSALWQLVVIIPLYYCVLVGSGWIIMSAHMAGDPAARDIIDRNDNNAAWWGLFHAISAFGNCGYSTFGDNMVQWQRYPLPLIVMSLLIFTGNTAFPLLLRGIIVALYHMPFLKRWKHVYRYMLDNPRRCFTHLFPSSETKWLLLVLLSLNSIEFLFEIMLDWDSSAYDNLNSGQKLVNMYFQVMHHLQIRLPYTPLHTDRTLCRRILWTSSPLPERCHPHVGLQFRRYHQALSGQPVALHRHDVHRRLACSHHAAVHQQGQRQPRDDGSNCQDHQHGWLAGPDHIHAPLHLPLHRGAVHLHDRGGAAHERSQLVHLQDHLRGRLWLRYGGADAGLRLAAVLVLRCVEGRIQDGAPLHHDPRQAQKSSGVGRFGRVGALLHVQR
jgi:hypothetical protein